MATLVIAVVYLAAMAIFNVIADNRLLAQVDTQLADSLGDVIRGATFASAATPDGTDRDVRSAPVLIWRVSRAGQSQAASAITLRFPAAAWLRAGRPDTVKLGATDFRVKAVADRQGWLVAGQSLATTQHVQTVLLTAQAVAGPLLLAAVFFGTLVVGLMASGPVEQARRRQLEFTADASHELRTPLSVIEAETGLALSATRDATEYQTALHRVSQEGRRLRRIVDDLLWLARFDSQPANPANEPVDVSTIAGICADRFSGLARLKGIELTVGSEGEAQAWIIAPPEWIDRLTGVLVDNACRYAAGRDGTARDGAVRDGAARESTVRESTGRAPTVRITVGSHGSRVTLTVEDSGPGIPEDERARLFDRFYRVRAGDDGGSGLGLAIADAVARSTGGRWRVDDSPLGGARMQVTWHRSTHRTGPHRRVSHPRAESPPATAPPGSAAAARAASRRPGSR